MLESLLKTQIIWYAEEQLNLGNMFYIIALQS